MSEHFNPYAPPQSQVAPEAAPRPREDAGPWREGKDVVALPDSAFPQRCVKCNAPLRAEQMRRRDFAWHHPALYLVLLLNLLLYVLIAVLVRKRSRHVVGLCERHLRRRRIFIAIGWSCLIWPFVGVAFERQGGVLYGVLLAAVTAIVGVVGSRVMVARRIDAYHARFAGCGKDFVASLPLRR